MIVGFCGPIGSGKSTAAQHLVRHHGYERVRFAGPLKAMLRALGLSEREVDGDAKEVPSDLLGGCTPRKAMQLLGTEWGRECIHPDLWVNAWRHACRRFENVVVDDVRFANEVAAIHGSGGRVLRLIRAGTEPAEPGHQSEAGNLSWDGFVINNGGLSDLEEAVNRALAKF